MGCSNISDIQGGKNSVDATMKKITEIRFKKILGIGVVGVGGGGGIKFVTYTIYGK